MPKILPLLLFVLLPLLAIAQNKDSSNRSILSDTLKMKEVIIGGKSAVKVNGDTLSYMADSLSKNPNATAEEVLKKIPGVEITSDGKIMANGKEVTKLFINGKLYTSEDIRTLTQNMPAQVLEKIQLTDWFDEESQFTGIKKGKSTEKSLNLKIKKEYERGIYGQVIAGLGTKDTYQAGTFTNYMSHDTRITAIGKINNTGMQDVGITNSGNADNTRSSTPNASGTTIRKVADLSFSNDPGKKLKINGSYNAWFTDNSQQQSSLRNTYLPGDSSLLQQQNRDINSLSNNHRINTRADWTIDSLYSMQTDIGLSYRNNTNTNHNNDGTYYNTTDNVNFTRQSDTKNNTEGYGLNIANVLRKKFKKKGRTASVDGNVGYNSDKTNGYNDNLNQYYYPFSSSSIYNSTNENRDALRTSAGANYNEPIGKHTLSVYYRNNYSLTQTNRTVNNTTATGSNLDTIQSREYGTYNMEHFIKAGHQYKTDKFRSNLEFSATPFSRIIFQKGYSNTTSLKQNNINYQTGLYLSYDFNEETSISLHSNSNVRQPDVTQLQTIPDYRDSLNINLGNPALRPETNNSVYTYFSSNSKNGKRNLWASLNVNWSYNKIINKTDITASKRITMPVNINGFYYYSASAGYSLKTSKILSVSISGNAGYNNNISYINSQLLSIPNKNASGTAKLTAMVADWYEGDVSYNYYISSISATNNTVTNLQRHTITTTGTFTLPYQIRFIYYLNYLHNEGITASFNPDFVLVNATVEKAFKKPKGLVLRAQGFDVFNDYPNVQRTLGDNYYEDRSANRLGRFFIFSIIYKFSYFPAKQSS